MALPSNASAINISDKIADTIKTTAGYFTNGDGTIGGTDVHTGSLSDTNEQYYFNVTQTHPLTSSAEVQFAVTYGDARGYGSDTYKQVYIYGGLDQSPTILKRAYGMSWGLGGWLLTPMIGKLGTEKFLAMRQRVAKEIKTTFASSYTQELSFEEMLQPEIIKSYAKQATGKKYLVTPQK